MWLLPVLSRIASLAMRTFYRFEVRGESVPSSGPVLLVANHPNSILDGGAVSAAAGRPIRFLAKAPLFQLPVAGPLIRASGAIPVYRRQDDPTQTEKNEEMFRAVRVALVEGSAVGIFPEGISHNLPALAPLRTGAARIALGAASMLGKCFPIVPMGLFFHRKEVFRSRALAFVGPPVVWEDICNRGEDDADAVRELTRRIEDAIRAVTVNLERWEDAPAVESAAAIYAAEFSRKRGPEAHVQRLKQISEGLRQLRNQDPDRLEPLFRAVLHFRDILNKLGVKAGDLSMTPELRTAARWISRRSLFLLLLAPVALIGRVIFYPPYLLMAFLDKRWTMPVEVRSTFKVLCGAILYLLWVILLAVAIGFRFGVWPVVAALVILPIFALATVTLYERVRQDLEDARRFLRLRRRSSLRERLLARRGELAREIEALRVELGLPLIDVLPPEERGARSE